MISALFRHRFPLPTPLRRFWKRRDGATAVEFALIAMPFFMLLIACFDLALIMIGMISLDMATSKASREIRTGILTAGNSSRNAFRTEICSEMAWISDCNSKLQVDVRTFDNFNLVPLAEDPIADGAFVEEDMQYTIGEGNKIQLVRAYFPWKTMSPFLSGGFNSLSSGEIVLTSRSIFRNEPF